MNFPLNFAVVSVFGICLAACTPHKVPYQGVQPGPAQRIGQGGTAEPGGLSKMDWSGSANLSAASSVSASTKALVGQLSSQDTVTRFSPAAYTLLARGVREQVHAEFADTIDSSLAAFRELTPKPVDLDQALANAQSEYQSTKGRYEFGHQVLATNNRLVQLALRAGTVVSTASGVGVLEGLALGALSESSSAGLDKVLKLYDDAATNAAQKVVALKLKNLSESAWRDWDNLPKLPPEQARAFVAKQVNAWSSELGAEVNSADGRAVRAVFDGFLLRATTAQLAKEASLRELSHRQISESIRDASGQIVAISQAIVGFGEEAQKQLAAIQNTQNEIKSGIERIRDGIQSADAEIRTVGDGVLSLNHSIGFVNEFVFGRMSPEEQILALRQGIFPGLEDSKRKELEEKIAIIEKRMELEANAANYLSSAQTLIHLGSKLGVSSDVLKTAQEIVNVGNTAETMFSAMMNGSGYLGVVDSIAGIVGLGGPNIAEQQHQQIMAHLNVLIGGQKAIIDNQKVLLNYHEATVANQKIMMENQKELHKGMTQISEQIRDYHVTIMEKLDRIHTDILINRDMIRAAASKNVEMCDNFLTSRNLSDEFDASAGGFKSYSGLRNHFQAYSRQFFSCADGLEELVGNLSLSKLFLSTESFKKTNSGVETYISKIFSPALDLLRTKHDRKDDLVWVGLSIPAEMTQGIEIKRAELVGHGDLVPSYDLSLLEEPLAAPALEQVVRYLIEVYPYFDLVSFEGGGKLDDVSTILAKNDSKWNKKKAALLLKRALDLVNLAIAQENVVAGDALLPSLYQDGVEWVDCKDSANSVKPLCVIQANSLLARNFVLYGLKKDLEATSNNMLVYEFAKNLKNDPHLLKAITVKPWNFVWSQDQWMVQLGDRTVPLPSAEQLFNDKIEYRPEMARLIRLRGEIAGVLAQTSLGDENSSKRDYYLLLLESI